VVPRGRWPARSRHHAQAAVGGLRRRRTRPPAAVRRHPLQRAALERRHGPSRSPRQRPVRAVLGAVDDLPTGHQAGGALRSRPGQALQSWSARQGSSTQAQGWPLDRCGRLPARAYRLRHARTGPSHRSGSGVRPAHWPVRRALAGCTVSLVQAAARPAAAALGRALHARTTGCRLRPSARFGLVDVRRLERILVLALEHEGHPAPPTDQRVQPLPSGRFVRPGSAFDHRFASSPVETQP
jgi:hypothetical protein